MRMINNSAFELRSAISSYTGAVACWPTTPSEVVDSTPYPNLSI